MVEAAESMPGALPLALANAVRTSRASAASLPAADRFEASGQALAFGHRLSFLDGRLLLDVSGRVDYGARRLDLEVSVDAEAGRIEHDGRSYDVGRVTVSIRCTGFEVQVQEAPFCEEGDPLQMALELAQALNRIACGKGRKRIRLVFDSARTFAKIAGIDGGRFLQQVVALVRLVEQTSDLLYRGDRQPDLYTVGVSDHIRRGVVRTLQFRSFQFRAEIRAETARALSEPGPAAAG